jgi:predicted RNA-binding protein associated with RNAse of E/G family
VIADDVQYGGMSADLGLTPKPRQHAAHRTEEPHSPKVETFDLTALTNTDPKGCVRTVEEYRLEPFGLYMAREMVGHPQFSYIESWLLPELDLRLTDFWFRPGHERDQDFYLDVARIEPGEREWRTMDLYLDIVVRNGRGLSVVDTDELLAANKAELIGAEDADRALHAAFNAVAGIAGAGNDLRVWLESLEMYPVWRRH